MEIKSYFVKYSYNQCKPIKYPIESKEKFQKSILIFELSVSEKSVFCEEHFYASLWSVLCPKSRLRQLQTFIARIHFVGQILSK